MTTGPRRLALGPLILLSAPLFAGGWRAGVARVDITPTEPVWLAGYAARKEPSRSVAGPILVKALALEDPGGQRLVAVTCDLLTLPRSLAEPVAQKLGALYGLPRARVLLSASHSHSAPVIRDPLLDMYFLDDARLVQVDAYTRRVEAALLTAATGAIESLAPAEVAAGSGTASFAQNRRRVHPDDPVDHEVPVLSVRFASPLAGAGPQRQAVFFAYACHNTTLSGLDVCGDYAGFAQEEIERRVPGLTALFASGCGGDQNPAPRGSLDLAREHGRTLAGAVLDALSKPLAPLRGPTGAAFGWTPLRLVPAPSRADIEAQLQSDNAYVRQRARRLTERLEREGSISETYPYAAQVWRLGAETTLVALAGEVVVDYALRLKRELGAAAGSRQRVMVVAYANDCPAYIPSERVLREGGYEGGGAMVYYGLHGPWASGVEEAVVAHVHRLHTESLRPSPMTTGAIERLWGEGAFTEGPACGPDGALYWSDIPNERILRLQRGNVFVFRRPSGKANGLAFDPLGRLVACEGADGGLRRVTRTEPSGAVTVLAERWAEKRLNSPNDLAVDSRGRVYFSDPRYVGSEPIEQDREAVYRVELDGTLARVIDDAVRPNGLGLSPDERTLYVSDNGAAKLYAYRIDGDRPRRERLVFDFSPGRGVDGMEVDAKGNIYAAAGKDQLSGVYVISPEGTLLDHIATPELATNCAFGEDGRTLFITAGKSLYRVRVVEEGGGLRRDRRF